VNEFPRQGATPPWELNMDYLRDRKLLLDGPVGDHMRFAGKAAAPAPAIATAAGG
jgi:hypothetical protein